jgi:hypothetical protein
MSNTHIDYASSDVHRTRSTWIQDVLPFVTSLSIHAAIVLAGLLTYQAIRVVTRPAVQEQTIIADSPFVSPTLPASPMIAGRDSLQIPGGPQPEVPDRWQVTTAVSAPLAGDLAGTSADTSRADTLFGAGSKVGARSWASADGPGGGSFGAGPGGPGGDGNAMFFRCRIPARKIAFVCDASGSMLPKFASLQNELSKAVENLKPIQGFNLIFFQNQSCDSFSTELSPATPGNKQKASSFLHDVIPQGTTDPLPGLEMAFRQKPQMIYLLTDGDFPDNQAVLRKIRELDADHRVKVYTIAFVDDADKDTDFVALLQQIARETGGIYKHISQSELP